MGPDRDGCKGQQVKNENRGSGDIAVSMGGREKLIVWEVRCFLLA